ncbi:nucleoside hydrolase [Olsenella sp. YH-ols2217]|uniref:Nucleoside hydrolase n=1 Tax=Kribbibacterium absianum TaxID=3044210 RepID=A0ABT6ZI15_9ACTN|nr:MULTISPECIES: nucleoside hydrolase [unclassified Olsenella]MDJ1121041.1 nucleoside hydrolase [Olsenella sp. YH-ols2216]MDJ1128532.1 nucleoside hydrolase [Olsenella sp. YH-ols2217]
MAKKIILDCDPGHDDAVAMLLAHANPEIELLGVTTIGGNQTLDKVTHNAQCLATEYGMEGVPIHAGCDRPLLRPVNPAAKEHGESGLDGVVLPEPAPLSEGHAVDFIIDTIMENEPGTVTLVPTGPLTNIAMAVRKEPRIVDRVKEVVLMGGGVHVGNRGPVAEFNIWTDPEAAKIVFNEPWPITMVGLDLTHQALATDEVAKKIADLGGPVADFVLGLFTFFRKAYQDSQGFEFPPVHDPCTVAYLIDPDIVKCVKVPIDVETAPGITNGMTVADFNAPIDETVHTQAAMELDFDGFWSLVVDAIDRVQKSGKGAPAPQR